MSGRFSTLRSKSELFTVQSYRRNSGCTQERSAVGLPARLAELPLRLYSCIGGGAFFTSANTRLAIRFMICATTSNSDIISRLEKGAPEMAAGFPLRYNLYSTVARYSGLTALVSAWFGLVHTPPGLVWAVPDRGIVGSVEACNSTSVVYTT